MLIWSLRLPLVRIEAYIFVSFIACCLLVTLKDISCRRVGGLTLRATIEAFRTIRMVDVHLPTTDRRRPVPQARNAPRISSRRHAARCPAGAVYAVPSGAVP